MTAGLQPMVLQYLTKNANVTVFVLDIAKDLGLSRKQVMNALYNLRQKDSLDIEALGDGAVVYRGLAKNHTKYAITLESDASVVALLNDNRVLLEIEGSLYVATELELP